jgi:exo-beta-1,3-glucanase (GH17 family)
MGMPNTMRDVGDALFKTLHTNPLAPFITRVVQFGSEPLFDQVLPIDQLIEQVPLSASAVSFHSYTLQVVLAKKNLSSLGIPVTVSELAYGMRRD